MSRKILLFPIAVLCLAAYGQTGAQSSSAPPAVPAQSWQGTGVVAPATPVQPIPRGNGLALYGGIVGYYGESAAAGGPVLNTPVVSLESPVTTAGISNAGRAGISNNPANALPQASSPEPIAGFAPATPTGNAAEPYGNAAPENAVTNGPDTTAGPEPRRYDFGPSYFGDHPENAGQADSTAGMSLAQIAEYYKALEAKMTVQTYTNADIPAPSRQTPANHSRSEEDHWVATNRLPEPPVRNTGETPTATAPESTAPPGAAATPSSSEQQQSSPQRSETQGLPASSSTLPLLGLLGVIAIGVGLWLRGLRAQKRGLTPGR
jgi:hypothetical protein